MEKKEILTLNGIRGLAILMVVCVHLTVTDFLPPHGWTRLFHFVFWMGWTGVDLFFALSGFLITGILIDTKASSNFFSSFYIRRLLRIFPLYYFFLLLVLLVSHLDVFSGVQFPTPAQWLLYFTYLQNGPHPGEQLVTALGHLWSLAVEEQFYLLWPLCVALVPTKYLLKICILLCLLAFGLRFLLVQHDPISIITFVNVFCRMDSLLYGAIGAIIVRSPEKLQWFRKWSRWMMATAVIGMFLVCFVAYEVFTRSYYTQTFGYMFLGVLYSNSVVLAYLADGTGSLLDRILRNSFLRSSGKYSYGLYVYHGTLFTLVHSWAFHKPWFTSHVYAPLCGLCAVILSFVVAMTSYRFFEAPVLRLKTRFQPDHIRQKLEATT